MARIRDSLGTQVSIVLTVLDDATHLQRAAGIEVPSGQRFRIFGRPGRPSLTDGFRDARVILTERRRRRGRPVNGRLERALV